MALFRGIQEYIALDANNITLVFDSGNIVNISGNIFLYPPQGHPILYKYCPVNNFNIARTLCDQSFPRIALSPAHLSYCCYVPQAFAFVR